MRARSAIRPRAASMSASVGAVFVAKMEHLLEYLADRRQRVELPSLHFVEEPPELRVPRHRVLEVLLRSCRRDGEDLVREVPAAPLLQPPVLGQPRAVRLH